MYFLKCFNNKIYVLKYGLIWIKNMEKELSTRSKYNKQNKD